MNEPNALSADEFVRPDEGAFAKLVGQHHSSVFRLCLRMLGHHEDAEDATQETFTRAARYLHRWDRGRPLEPWLITIAGNRCRTFLARKRSLLPLAEAGEPATEATCPTQRAESLWEEVSLALSELPENQRHAFELFHRQSLGYAEIARQLGCPVGTAKTWVHRARLRLVEILRARDVVQPGPTSARKELAGPLVAGPLVAGQPVAGQPDSVAVDKPMGPSAKEARR